MLDLGTLLSVVGPVVICFDSIESIRTSAV